MFAPLQAVQPLSPSSLPAHPHDGSAADPAAHLTRLDTARVSALRDSERATTEMRYSTMLDIIHGDHSASAGQQRNGFTKLIGDSNPLSALLRKDLKDKVRNDSKIMGPQGLANAAAEVIPDREQSLRLSLS